MATTPPLDPLLADLSVEVELRKLAESLGVIEPLLAQTARAFETNLSTANTLLRVPAVAVDTTVRRTTEWDMAAARALATGVDLMDPGLHAAIETFQRTPLISQKLRETTTLRLNELLREVSFREAVRALLASATTSAWTAIEVLAGDLWEVVLNTYPSAVPHQFEKAVPLSQLHLHGFDLRAHMGSILRAKCNFKSVNGIRQSYDAIFGKDVARSMDCDALVVLEATRHVLVHKAGVVDGDYIGAWKAIAPEGVFAFSVGELLPLNGSIVSGLLSAALCVGRSLISAVDHWARKRARRGR